MTLGKTFSALRHQILSNKEQMFECFKKILRNNFYRILTQISQKLLFTLETW